ncbi:hypothetical protein [Enterobacter phage N5822]|nr:hypothetical protein [Enterobacter phage N5822]QPD96259.1 hypothetical protein [Enterobacter phage N5822]
MPRFGGVFYALRNAIIRLVINKACYLGDFTYGYLSHWSSVNGR